MSEVRTVERNMIPHRAGVFEGFQIHEHNTRTSINLHVPQMTLIYVKLVFGIRE